MKILPDIRYAQPGACLLDWYLPDDADRRTIPTVLLFHGGGLVHGNRLEPGIPEAARTLTQRGIAVASAEYRMFPDARYPDFLEDAAAAAAFILREQRTHEHPGRLFVGGLSAGAYLSMMLCFDSRWLCGAGLKPQDIAGYIHGSAQPTKHFSVLAYSGEDPRRLIVDETAPLFHVRPGMFVPPMQILVSDQDMTNRALQNELLRATMEHMGFDMTQVDFRLLHGTHCSFARERDVFGNSVFAGLILEFLRDFAGENIG